MYLLFSDPDRVWLGEVIEDKGAIRSIELTPQGENCLLDLYATWQREGIKILKTLTRVNAEEKTNIFVYESVPLRSREAVSAMIEYASKNGFFVSILDEVWAPYWEELKTWPVSDTVKYHLVFLMHNLKEKDIFTWQEQWKVLTRQMAQI